MAFGNSTFANIGGAVSDILEGEATSDALKLKAKGNLFEADNYDLAQTLARENARFTEQSTAIKKTQAERELYLGMGQTVSDVAGSGFSMSGSALDLMRMGASQGALTQAVIQQQGLMTEYGYNVQADSYRNMAEASRYAAAAQEDMADDAERNSYITAGIKGASAIASLFI